MEAPSFSNPDEEIAYWRSKAEDFMKGMLDAREELDEYQIGSKELEIELEAHIEQLEKRNHELVHLTEKLTAERDQFRSHSEAGQSHLHSELTALQEELAKYKHEKENSQKYIRQLEQENDNLERSQRTALTSIEDIETKLNQALERTAILENELDEKEDLMVTVQRLKDEARDLHHELATTRRQPSTTKPLVNGSMVNPDGDSADKGNREETMVQTEASSITTVLSPPVRLAALSMVNDALQKISQLEFKLSTLYQSYGTPPVSASPANLMASFNFTDANGGVDLTGTGAARLRSISRQSSAKRRQSDQSWTKADRLVPQYVSATFPLVALRR